jgi:hypothetical protein
MGLASQYINNEPSSKGLVAHWPLDIFRNGAIVRDVAGVSNGTGTNSPTLAYPGMLFAAVSIQYVECGKDASLDLTTLSIASWVKLQAGHSALMSVLCKGSATTRAYRLDIDANKKVSINGGSNDAVPGDEVLPEEKWTFVGGSFNSTTGKIYVNDSAVEAETITAPAVSDTVGLLIGARYGFGEVTRAEYFDGHIADVRLYDRVLTDAEFHDIYRMTRGRFNI